MLVYFSLAFFVWLIGLLMRLFCPPKYPTAAEIGGTMFWVGLLAWLLHVGAASSVHIP